MTASFRIFAVDDEPGMRMLLEDMLSDEFSIETFANAESFLERMSSDKPDMLILDVGLPDIDGYEVCRRIKSDFDTSHIPVTFISGHDNIEALMSGYEAGGEDFIVKPFEPAALQRKVGVAQRIIGDQRQLRDQANYAQQAAMSAITSMGELGVVIQFLRSSFACNDAQSLAKAVIDALGQYGLDGAVQIRMGDETLSLSPEGQDLPLETSVLNYARKLGRIFEVQQRSGYNFGGITLLVNNMPLDDPDRCGRIRDNLAILAEGADARCQAIQIETANRRTQEGVLSALEKLRSTLSEMQDSQKTNQFAITQRLVEVQEDMVRTFVSLGLTDRQEHNMIELVRGHISHILDLVDRGADIVGQLELLADNLKNLAR
jgi:DNA-binding response OmpR family regulator